MKLKLIVMSIFLLAVLSCSNNEETQQANEHQIFVAPNGNDQQAGSKEQPLATLQKAIELAEKGDTVFIRGGDYQLSQMISFTRSGKSNAWITFMAYQDENPVFNSYDFDTTPNNQPQNRMHDYGAFHFEGVHHIRLQGITVKDSRGVGIMVRDESTHHIEITNCKTDGSYSSGIALWYADSSKVLNCDIQGANDQELRPPEVKLRGEAPHEALTTAGATHFEVAYNKVHHCIKEGIDCKEVSAFGTIHHNECYENKRQGLYVDSWFGKLHDVEFHHNKVYNCEWGMAVAAEGENSSLENVKIHHNQFYNNRGSGVFFSVWGHDEIRKNIYVYNNTIYNNGNPTHWAGPTGGIDMKSSSLQEVHIFNNICSDNAAFQIATFDNPGDNGLNLLSEKNIHISHNLVHVFVQNTGHTGLYPAVYATNGDEPVLASPMFEDPATGNFALLPSSPAIRAGMPSPPVDNADQNLGAGNW